MRGGVTFWQLPEDETDFLDVVETTGNILAVSADKVTSKELLDSVPLSAYIREHDPDQLLFGLEHHVRKAPTRTIDVDGKVLFGIKYMEPCLISYSRGGLRERQLTQSNLAAYWDYPNDDATAMIRKDPEFTEWAKKVFAWVRRRTPEKLSYQGYEYRATKRAAEAARAGQIEPVPY